MLEVHTMANGWLVTGEPNRLMDTHKADSECYVFNQWTDLVKHIKKELSLSGPEQTQGDEDCKSL